MKNEPAYLVSYWEAGILGAAGGEIISFDHEDEAHAFNADPDGWAARHFGLSVPDYLEWVELDGVALCGAKTKKGKPCCRMVGGHIQLGAMEWLRLHRKRYCAVHGEQAVTALRRSGNESAPQQP